ncbi:CGNR zinc finger domain-containing protein [Georgenia sp. TF02-10]|uniref:CGNR zinc finger domain-containing protein n=1 Tax=Georgenia sp. TF02-10 TaxID=2917725 RepID=UPI001FA78F6A|nr:CGNR zinc finger domain-containing protein [Georgenia sp. TF02-10]UNX55692.1 CGNR zinc finger domain-containing protein [Georgenia sp. TF02-10]
MTEPAVPPGALLVRDFVNTREPQTGGEELTTPEALRDWFAARGLADPDAPVDDRDLADALAVREGLRQALLVHAGHDADPQALADLDRRLAAVPLRLSLADGSARLRPTRPRVLDLAVAAVADAVLAAAEDGSWPRLKVCARDTCRWAFYDGSRNQARRWCSMAGCGNYVKMQRVAAARRRRAAG